MKKISLLVVLLVVIFTGFGQKNAPVKERPKPINPVKDNQAYQGYGIRNILALPMGPGMGSYGLDILEDKLKIETH